MAHSKIAPGARRTPECPLHRTRSPLEFQLRASHLGPKESNMSVEAVEQLLPPPEIPPSAPHATSRRGLWFELGVVILLWVIPNLFTSFALTPQNSSPRPFAVQGTSILIRSLGAIGLILLIVWRSGEPWSAFGLHRFKVSPDIYAGICIYVLTLMMYRLAWSVLGAVLSRGALTHAAAFNTGLFAHPRGILDYGLLLLSSFANGWAEELVMRAYLIFRLSQLTRSPTVACMVSTALFAAYHSYQGPAGMIGAIIFGSCYCGSYLLARRVAPVAFAHGLQDVVGWMSVSN
jgi:membrane protease YdiL (CAAX protease family)